MAVARMAASAAVTAISNQVLTIAGAITTEGAGAPADLTSIIVKTHQSQSAQRYLKLFDVALTTDVNADHITGLTLCLPIKTLAAGGKRVQKFVFPNGLKFGLGIQACIDTTPGGNTAAATTTIPEEVLFFFVRGGASS
jgi:hypothetical protein